MLFLGTVCPYTHTSVNTDNTNKVSPFQLQMRTYAPELIQKKKHHTHIHSQHKKHA